jgi:hypothetical protein
MEGEVLNQPGALSDLEVQDDAFDYYRERLSRGPVWHEGDTDLYVIGGHTEARAALMDVATFSSRPAAKLGPADPATLAYLKVLSERAGRARPRSSGRIRPSTRAPASCSTECSRRRACTS